jgi:lysophospholipase L1-like esterase
MGPVKGKGAAWWILVGGVAVLALAEASLWAVSWALRATPDVGGGARYTILAEGDSFTYGIGGRSFPRQLEQMLNERAGGPLFQVVNRGEPGLNTTGLVSRFSEHLDEVHPDVVITTIGENNSWNTFQTDTAEVPWPQRLDMIAMKSRLYRFFRVWVTGWDRATFHEGSPTVRDLGNLSTLPEAVEVVGLPQEEEQMRGERETSTPTSYTPEQVALYERAFALRDAGDYAGAVEAFEVLLAVAPSELAPYVGAAGALIRLYRNLDAIAMIERGRAQLPQGTPLPDYAVHGLHLAYKREGDRPNAIRVLVEALRADPSQQEPMHALSLLHYEDDGNVWAALEDVADVPGIEGNELYGYLQRLSTMTEGRVGALNELVSESFARDMRALAYEAHVRGVKSIWTSYPLHAYQEIHDVAGSLGISYIDFRPHFARRFTAKEQFLASDGCHCNTEGYELMAELLADEVLDVLELQLPERAP